MKKEIKPSKLTALASSVAIIGAFGTSANATELFNYEDLGTGSELRSNLITADALTAFTSNTDVEFECGEGKCGEGKCGEGKCGTKSEKKDEKKDTKATMDASPKATMKASPKATQMPTNTMQPKDDAKPVHNEGSKESSKGEKPNN